MHPVELRTDRLLLRQWRSGDRATFAELNTDPSVMEYFPSTMSPAQSDALADRIEAQLEERGWGLWALEVLDSGEYVGFAGLAVPGFHAHFMPAVEIGWRLARDAWGKGYATEAANAALEFGFDTAGLDTIVSFTTQRNVRSRAVMQRIGMTHEPDDDFDHPSLNAVHPLRRHVLYRLDRTAWEARRTSRQPYGADS